ncbi:restriction endonuclease subunit S [Sulfitobacter sp. 1A15299]|uniref:restriction endonuclease subunit S n=1 Tax=Sulfitobacter sp. 1A15299 TaxID=3368598 RepID=UPI00374720CF
MKFEAPTGWDLVSLSQVATVQTGLAKGKVVNGQALELPYLRVANVQDGHLDLEVIKTITVSPESVARFSLQPGDVLFTEGGDFDKLGRGTVWRGEIPNCLHQNHVFAVRPSPSKLLPEFLAALASSAHGRRYFQLSSKQSTNLASINSTQLKEFPVPLPSLDLQRNIVEILGTWDKALEKLATLRASKQDRFNGLSQQIMGRGGVFPERWPLKSLSAVSTPVRRKSAGDNHPVMTISAKSGFLMQSDKFARDMAGRSVERYTLLHEGEFAYNKGNSKTAPYGCVFRLDRPTALVPFVYYCFALKPGFDPEFYEHLFAAGALNHQLSRLINSGVRNDGLLNLYSDHFYSCRVPVPPIYEQRKIARALTAAKQELVLLDEEIEALTRMKRGLMQKLLTGEWRVPLDPVETLSKSEESEHAG